MTKLKIGTSAPSFSLPDQTGQVKTIHDYKADYIVLFFYPKDMIPGCTVEAEGFSEKIAEFKKLNAEVLGISGGDAASKLKFCKKNNLKISLLADEDFSVSKKFEVYGKKSFMGKTYDGIHRKTFIINRAGEIVQIYDEVKPEQHTEQVLNFLMNIGQNIE